MSSIVILALAMWGYYRALTLLGGQGDVLRLRTMAHLSLALAAMTLTAGPGAIVAGATALLACRCNPALRPAPLLSILLLLLTPTIAVIAVSVAIWGAGAFVFDSGNWALFHTVKPAALGLAILVAPSMGFGWRARLFAGSSSAGLAAAAFGADPLFWEALQISGLAAGWRLAIWRDAPPIAKAIKPLAVVVLVPALSLAARAGPWVQNEGEQLVILRTPISGRSGADGAFSVQSYSEAGLSDDVTFVATGFQERADRNARAGGAAHVRVALWREEGWILSGEAGAGLEPFSLTDSGAWEQHAQGDLSLLAGWSGTLEGLPVYAGVEAGWHFRPEKVDDAGVLAISGGIDLHPDLQLNLHGALTVDTSGRDEGFAQAGLLWRADDWIGLEVGVQAFRDADGDTSAQAVAGLWLRF